MKALPDALMLKGCLVTIDAAGCFSVLSSLNPLPHPAFPLKGEESMRAAFLRLPGSSAPLNRKDRNEQVFI
jgi:hypothetical protein